MTAGAFTFGLRKCIVSLMLHPVICETALLDILFRSRHLVVSGGLYAGIWIANSSATFSSLIASLPPSDVYHSQKSLLICNEYQFLKFYFEI